MRRTTTALALVIFVMLPVAGLAQTVGGNVIGRASADGGQPLTGVSIVARRVETNVERSTTTDAAGQYRLSELPPGMYEFTASLSGFATEIRSGVQIFIGQQATLDFALKVSAVAETVTVQGEAPIVETTKSSIGANITRQQIDQLPLPERDFESLAFLAPGISPAVTEGDASPISGAGSSGASNTFLIDGMSNDQNSLGGTRGDYSPDAIAEYQVMSSQYAAEYGQASGAVINVVTRSGGNAYHGRASVYYRDDALTASDPFAPIDPETGEREKTPFDQWTPSAFLSGPIVQNKAFFFASYEETLRDATAVVAVDPALLEALGLGTQTTFPQDLTEPRAVFKLDYHPVNSQTLTFRFRLDNPTTTNSAVGDSAAGAVVTEEAGFTLKVQNTDYGLLHSWVISSNTMNDARFQYARQSNDALGVNCPDCTAIIRPSLISGKLPNQPQSFTENRYQFIDSLSWNLGAAGEHFVKAGVDYSHVNLDAFVPQNFDGAFIFTTDAPFNADDQATYPFIYQVGSGNPFIEMSNNIVGLYVQDQWSVAPNLTLNIGLRWDYEDQTYVKNDWQNFGPRIHFAWDPTRDGMTNVRGGFGMYYDQVFLNAGLISEIFAPGRFTFQTILFPGYPDPLVGGQQVPIELPPDISVLDPSNTTPYKNVGSLGVQRQLTPDMAASVDFVYARGYHLLGIRDANAPIDGVRPDPNVGIAYEIDTEGNSEYLAMQIGFQKRFSNCFSAQLAYNLASNKTDTDGTDIFGSDSYNRGADWGPSLDDIRNTLTAGVNYQGPWGILLGVGGTFLSGAPYNITTGTDDNGDAQLTDRPEGVGHNSARGDSNWTVNVQLGKAFAIDQTQLELLVQVFNLFNHTNPAGYVGNLSSVNYGEPTRTAEALGLGPRSVQVGLRFDF
jgi:outer membrane receptor for ferrienterochelin and colicin